jgi:UTP--glucose-1-phosphate uridylyltransferase
MAIKEYVTSYPKNKGLRFSFINQAKPLGLGDAVLRTEKWVNKSSFIVSLPDDIIIDAKPCINNLIKLHRKYGSSIIAVENVQDVTKYGIIDGDKISDDLYRITNLIEKPAKNKVPTHIGIVGRYLLTDAIFQCIKKLKRKNPNIIELTDAIRLLLKKEDVYAYLIKGKRYDCGDIEGYKRTLNRLITDVNLH